MNILGAVGIFLLGVCIGVLLMGLMQVRRACEAENYEKEIMELTSRMNRLKEKQTRNQVHQENRGNTNEKGSGRTEV